jgi:inhibitor of cysteine peptidase
MYDSIVASMAASCPDFILEGKRPMTRLAISVTSALLFFSWMLVAQTPQSPETAQKGPSTVVTITDQDNGKDIDLPKGATLVVRLKSNPSTGYSWAIKSGPSLLRLVKSATKKADTSSHVVGVPVIQEFRPTAVSAGMASLAVEYRRPWEHNVAPAKTFKVKVNAR